MRVSHEHADHLEQQLQQHASDQAIVTLHLTEDMFLRSSNWARVRLGIPLPVEG
jgi:L-ascorbate metabolism protein UlaG (beta-lactamase superfamily)